MYLNNNTTISTCQINAKAVSYPLTAYVNPSFGKIRVMIKDDEPWFVAYDVATTLGYSKPENAVARYCKAQVTTPKRRGGFFTIIPERDLYRLIMRSKLPAAEQFVDWVVGEVLPTIRKHGVYATPEFVESALADLDNMIQALKKAWRQRDYATAMATASRLSKENNKLREQVGDSKSWEPLRSIDWLAIFFNLNEAAYSHIEEWLTKESLAMGLEPRVIEHSKWGTVKTYHSDVITVCMCVLMDDRNLLRRYRKY